MKTKPKPKSKYKPLPSQPLEMALIERAKKKRRDEFASSISDFERAIDCLLAVIKNSVMTKITTKQGMHDVLSFFEEQSRRKK